MDKIAPIQNKPKTLVDDNYRPVINAIYFLWSSRRIIVITTVLGVLLATFYILMTPKQYTAKTQIIMAQIAGSDKNIMPFGANIEEPIALINRLSLPTSYGIDQIEACGLSGAQKPLEAMAKIPKWNAPRGVAGIVEVSVTSSTTKIAKDCIESLFLLIQGTQEKKIAAYIKEAEEKLAGYQRRIEAYKKHAPNVMGDQSKEITYSATWNEYVLMVEQVLILRNLIGFAEAHGASLAMPIYVDETPVAPKITSLLAGGFFWGLIIGIFIAYLKSIFSKIYFLKKKLPRS
jgi:hypothetical protein